MKQNYSLKKTLLTLSFLPALAFGQTLADVQCNINLQYTAVTDTVPDMYVFNYDGGIDFISDGGGDMYDSGNYLNTDIATDIDYSDDVIIASTDFGPNGQYFTRELPGFFMLAADLDAITTFYISGGNGADGSGSAMGLTFTTSAGGTSHDVFFKQVYGDGDPSICHFIIIPSNSAASHTFATDTDDDQHDLNNITASTRLYYFLVSSSPDNPLSDDRVMDIANTFLMAISGDLTFEALASATDVCEGEMVTLTGSGGTGYSWNNGVVDGVAFTPPVGTTLYTLTGLGANGCNSSAGVEISTIEVPDFTLSTADALFANDGGVFLTLNSGVFPFLYDWDNDGTGDFNDPQNLINVGAGSYTVVVEDGNGCTATATAIVGSQVGIENNETQEAVVYPNPTSNLFTIKFNGAFDYQVTNLAGQLILEGNAIDSEVVSLETVAAGTYLITVNSESTLNTIQIVKQ